jgi:hypothetical protein
MTSTYTPKLNLAKPANGDVDWHIPINGNWDKIDTELDKALKISGTTIDADKDWSGMNITNVGTLSANTLILSESRFTIAYDITKNAKYLMKSDDAETGGGYSEGWTLMKSLPPLPASVLGTENSVYVSYQHKSSNPLTTWTQIYVNGVAVGTERIHESTLYTTWDEVITGLKAGDIIQIYGHRYLEDNIPYVRNLRVYGVIFQSIPMPPGIW